MNTYQTKQLSRWAVAWRRPAQANGRLRRAMLGITLAILTVIPSAALAQIGIGVGGGGGGGVRIGGGGGGGGVRVGGNVGGQATTRAAVRAPSVGANVGTGVRANVNPSVGVRANVNPAVSGTLRGTGAAAGAAVNPAVSAGVRTAQRIPLDAGAAAGGRTNIGAGVNTNGGAGINLDAARRAAAANTRLDGAAALNAKTGINANTGVGGAQLGVNSGLNAAVGANALARARWHNLPAQQLAGVRTNLSTALAGNAAANVGSSAAANVGSRLAANLGVQNYIVNNPQRAALWGGWGNGVRGNFFVGRSPFFGGPAFYNQNFWSGRNLIGLGLTSAGYGRLGAGVAGYPMWWGYNPWLGYRPWTYWWGTPTWGGVCGWFPNYGWNQPYFYDYGMGGNVVYQGNNVLVNGQVVGTTSDYAQTAADLAAIDTAAIGQTAPEDWLPLGTFSMSVSQDEANPPRVVQLAVNKQGLVSGTVYNRNSDKLYTVQGRVDKDTQRVAFTIGDQADTVLETGLFNLTQEQTPILVHYGPSKTATYLFARLPVPEAQAEAQTTQSANAAAELGINR